MIEKLIFRDRNLRFRIMAPMGSLFALSSIVILYAFIKSNNNIRWVVLPEERAIHGISLETSALLSECREYVISGHDETLGEIDEILQRHASHLARFKEADQLKHNAMSNELDEIAQNFYDRTREILGLRGQVESKKDWQEEHSVLTRIASYRLWQKLSEEESPSQAHPSMRYYLHLQYSLENYLARVQELFLPLTQMGQAKDTQSLEKELFNHLDALKELLAPGEMPLFVALEDQIHIIRGWVHEHSEKGVRLMELLEELEELEQKNNATLTVLRDMVEKDTKSAFSVSFLLISSIILMTFFCFLFLSWIISASVSRSLERLNRATRNFGPKNLDYRVKIPYRDEIGHLAGSFNQMAENLKLSIHARERAEDELIRNERLATVGQLTATVSHELRNPLGSIRTSLTVISRLNKDTNPLMKSSIEIADRNIDRCDGIITDLLDFTRVRKLALEPTDVDTWLERCLDEQKSCEGVRLVRLLKAKTTLAIDQNHFLRAFLNVFENACHAAVEQEENAPEEQIVTVASRRTQNRIEICISDTGPGIPEHIRDKIFEPLYSTKSFGVGLGLPTVKQIMLEHGGEVNITSEEGKGTVVVLSLPCSEETS